LIQQELLELERVLGRGFAQGDVGLAVGGKVGEAVIDVLDVAIGLEGDLLGGFLIAGEASAHLVEDFQEGGGGLLAGLDTGLVVGVDVDERAPSDCGVTS
jgi:hypothetical protein